MFERVIENLLYASRWMLAPIYLGLSTGLVSLVDMALVGGLLVMVMLSGYENFISSIDIKYRHQGWSGETRLAG
jgi:uncharacterized membrane protein YqhA